MQASVTPSRISSGIPTKTIAPWLPTLTWILPEATIWLTRSTILETSATRWLRVWFRFLIDSHGIRKSSVHQVEGANDHLCIRLGGAAFPLLTVLFSTVVPLVDRAQAAVGLGAVVPDLISD